MRNLSNKKDFKKTIHLINKYKNILIITHRNPDGDAIGSLLALYLSLIKLGKNPKPFCVDPIPSNFLFLPESLKVVNQFNIENFDMIIVLDCASSSQTGLLDKEKEVLNSNLPLINIDHHISNPYFGTVNIVNPKAAACAQILYFLIPELKIKINKYIATCLLTGLYTDTGSFMHDNTTSEVLNLASQLLILGGRFNKISSNIKLKTVPALKLWGRALSRIQKDRDLGIVISIITQKDLQECQACYDDLSGVVALINTIPNTSAALLLSEREGGEIKGSLRSEAGGLDVSKVAAIFGGGGHPRASGFCLKGRLKKEKDGWKIED
jgi:phosphoesterase RecJ-like protein